MSNYQFTSDQIAEVAAVVGGLTGALLLNTGPGLVERASGFFAGGVIAGLAAHWAADKDNINKKLVDRCANFVSTTPTVAAVVFVGMTAVSSIMFGVLLAPLLETAFSLVPIINTSNLTAIVVLMGMAGTFLFGGIAGWTVEVLEFVINPSAEPFLGKVPAKPGGRVDWGLTYLPKDLIFFLLAAPIGLIQQIITCIRKKSALPIIFSPLKIACDQWTRMGDVVLDLWFLDQEVETLEGEAAKFFEEIMKFFHHFESDQITMKGATLPTPQPPITWTTWEGWYEESNGGEQILYPLLFDSWDNQ